MRNRRAVLLGTAALLLAAATAVPAGEQESFTGTILMTSNIEDAARPNLPAHHEHRRVDPGRRSEVIGVKAWNWDKKK